jgi:hypothetical protein
MIENEKAFSNYIGGNLNLAKRSSPLFEKTWGTDVELVAAATMLQTRIFVYSPVKEDKRIWLDYKPLWNKPTLLPRKENIYLSNLCAHFERVTSVK